MTDRLHTIALMAAQFRIADGMSNVAHPHTEYIAEALALYRLTERAVTEAYRATSTPLRRDEDDETEVTGCWACGRPVAAVDVNPAAAARNECGRCGAH